MFPDSAVVKVLLREECLPKVTNKEMAHQTIWALNLAIKMTTMRELRPGSLVYVKISKIFVYTRYSPNIDGNG